MKEKRDLLDRLEEIKEIIGQEKSRSESETDQSQDKQDKNKKR